MTILLENPMPVILVGIVLEVVFGFLLLTTRQGKYLLPMGIILLLTIAGVVVERMVVTEREKVENTLHDAAAAIQANDAKRVEGFVAKSSSKLLRLAIYYMGMVEFEKVKLSNFRVEINKLTSPPTAVVHCDGIARYKDKTGMIPYTFYSNSFKVDLVREGDAWKVKYLEGKEPLPGNP